MVRLEPATTLMVPAATALAVGMLNTSGVGMSGAVTSTTTVAISVPERFALTRSRASTARLSPPVGSGGRQALSARRDATAAVIRRRMQGPQLRRDGDGGGTGNSL